MKVALLLSGGMDSTAIAYWLRPGIAFTVNYGQLSAKGEIYAAERICESLDIEHEVLAADCSSFASGALFGTPPCPLAPVPEWLPFRNQLLLTIGGIRAANLGLKTLSFGAVRSDAKQTDGTKEFFAMIAQLFALQEGKISVLAPAIEMTTVELIKVSKIPMSVLGWSHSCDVSNSACGHCNSCHKYSDVLRDLGLQGE
jgi:7-cyano-7-deazaguanine synthase